LNANKLHITISGPVNEKELILLKSLDRNGAKLVPAERHNFKMKRILAARVRKHNTMENVWWITTKN
jgi:hypothetical protein